MSHFTVAVITKDGNIHRALERYNEQDENYFCSYPTPIKDLIEDYKKTYNTDNEEILKERINDKWYDVNYEQGKQLITNYNFKIDDYIFSFECED